MKCDEVECRLPHRCAQWRDWLRCDSRFAAGDTTNVLDRGQFSGSDGYCWVVVSDCLSGTRYVVDENSSEEVVVPCSM